jgi:hypothetical protein
MTRERANQIIRNDTTSYLDYAEACVTIAALETERKYPGRVYSMVNHELGPVGRVHDQALASEPWPRGVVGALASTGKVGPKLLMRLDPPIGQYFIGPLGDGVGVGLFQHSSSEVPHEIEPGRMSDPDHPMTQLEQNMSARTGDFQRMAERRANHQRGQLRAINEANAHFWSQPENQGRS